MGLVMVPKIVAVYSGEIQKTFELGEDGKPKISFSGRPTDLKGHKHSNFDQSNDGDHNGIELKSTAVNPLQKATQYQNEVTRNDGIKSSGSFVANNIEVNVEGTMHFRKA